MRCANCGAVVPDYADVCDWCGMPVGGAGASPLRYVEGGLALVFVPLALILPTISMAHSNVSTLSAIGLLVRIGGMRYPQTLVGTIALATLLLVGVACSVVTAVMCFKPRQTGRMCAFSWGMCAYALGLLCIIPVGNAFVSAQDVVGTLLSSVGWGGFAPAAGAYACLLGGIACGVLDVVRCRMSSRFAG